MDHKVKVFVLTLFLIAFTSSVYWFSQEQINMTALLYFVPLVMLAEAFKVPVIMYNTGEKVKISWSMVITVSTIIGSGGADGIIVNIVGALVCSLYPKPLPLIKALYNISAYVATVTITYSLFYVMERFIANHLDYVLLEMMLLPALYLFVNFSLSTVLMKLLTKKSTKAILTDLVQPHLHTYILFGYIGGVQGYFYGQYGLMSLLFTSILIGVVLYSFKKTAENVNIRIMELEESTRTSAELASELDQTLEQFIHTLTATVDARDPYTFGHSLQVSNYALAIASELKLDKREIETIRVAGLLHDIGKISIPETILFKDGRLSDEEYDIMKQHAIIGEEILADIPRLKEAARLVGMHHERYNGSGYPRGMSGEDIPIGAHILGVSDTLDAILSSRSYKKGRTVEEAMKEFARCKGEHFHPDVVEALFALQSKHGDHVFKNSAQLIDQAVIVGKVKTNRAIMNWVHNGTGEKAGERSSI